MEPVFMILGQSAATAGALAIDRKSAVQKVPYSDLRRRLLKDRQVLEWNEQPRVTRSGAALPGVLLDDSQAKKTGSWITSENRSAARIGDGYIHDGNANKGAASISFSPDIPKEGVYDLALVYPPHPNRATNVPVLISITGPDSGAPRQERRTVNERKAENECLAPLGQFQLPKGRGILVTISNEGTEGYVVVDGLQIIARR
jgi:hypothetical protein